MGISQDEPKASHPQLDDDEIASAAKWILVCIRDVFSATDGMFTKMKLQAPEDPTYSVNGMAEFSEDSRIRLKRQPNLASRKDRLGWALGGKAKFYAQVETFGILVDKLYHLIPPEGLRQYAETGMIGQPDGPRNFIHSTPFRPRFSALTLIPSRRPKRHVWPFHGAATYPAARFDERYGIGHPDCCHMTNEISRKI